MEDLISRQDAINEIHKYFVEEIDKTPTEIDEDGDEVFADMPTVNFLLACNKELSKRIKSLPSAESTGAMDEAIQEYIKDGYMQPIGEDLISRQDAIRWVKTECNPYGKPTLDFESGKKVIDRLEQMPSAEPKTGRDCTDFVRWLMDEVMDEENWQMNAVANGEIICRKLKKLGMLDVVDGYYIKTQDTGDMKGW